MVDAWMARADPKGFKRRTAWTPVVGDPVDEWRDHNAVNQVTRVKEDGTPTLIGYDHGDNGADADPSVSRRGNGNLTDDGLRLYAYDAMNRLVQVKKKDGGAVVATYTYDALGRRIRKGIADLGGGLGGLTGDVPAGTTDYLYSGVQCVEENNPLGGGESTDTPTRLYVWGIYVDELIQQKEYAAGTRHYLLSDLLYRSVALTDDTGAFVEAYDTDAYGNTLLFSASGTGGDWFADNATTTDTPTCRYVFTGREYDAETQIYYYRARYYQQGLGRFVSRDPVHGQEPAYPWPQLNAYEYVLSQPAVNRDPSGQIIIGLGGWGGIGEGEVGNICEQIRTQVNALKGKVLRGGEEEKAPLILDGSDMKKTDTVIEQLKKFKKRKDADPCWHEQVILVGYSDGASTIWQVFNHKGAKTKAALASSAGGHYHVAFVGLIDMIRKDLSFGENLKWSWKGKTTPFDTLGVLDEGANFYQQEDWFMKGYKITTHPFWNVLVPGVSHKGFFGTGSRIIFKDVFTQRALALFAMAAYFVKEPYASAAEVRRPQVD